MKYLMSLVAVGAVAATSTAAHAQSVAFSDQLIQSPDLAPPSRGSVVGQYSSLSFGPGDLARGTYNVALPITLPGERGKIGASPIPSYSVDGGISEWGIGWVSPSTTIFRSRVIGDLDFKTDERTGPWGRMIKGTDGAWYPDGLGAKVRVVESGADLVAHLPDGSAWTFSAALGVSTPSGTFSWMLQSIVTVLGRTTTYAYTHNATGRPYLSTVTYGGTVPATPQYQIAFDYTPLTIPIVDYRSGKAVNLDQRVSTVHVRTLSGGAFVERHTWKLGFTQDGTGASFYLSTVQQTFAASGQVAPPVTYTYSLASAYFNQLSVQSVAKLTPALQAHGTGIILPNFSAQVDVDLDGRMDLESQYDFALLQQTDSGYDTVPLPSASAPNPACRPAPSAHNAPRNLARMGSGSNDVHVVALVPSGTQTQLVVCDRPGDTLWQTSLTGNWALGANTRLTDLNRDHLPDLIRVYPGGYQAMANHSTGSAFAMGAVVQGALSPTVAINTTWVHDLNGDGIPDLLGRSASGIIAWMGKGNLQFDPQGIQFQVLGSNGRPITPLTAYEFVFFDANNDGISDLLLSNGTFMMLFSNTGTSFNQVTVPLFSTTTWRSALPTVLDTTGNGNTELSFTQNGLGYAIDIEAPGIGLLTAADDGRGTTLQFGYQRAPAEVGVRYRNTLLSHVTMASTGYDPITYQYGFGKPDVHSLGLFLLGYEKVTRTGPTDTAIINFLNTDDSPGIVLSEIEEDSLSPTIQKVVERTYQKVAVRGVPWERPATVTEKWVNPASPTATPVSNVTSYLAYDSTVCPLQTSETNATGTLATTRVLSSPAGFTNTLACFDGTVTLAGTHADATLNFTHKAQSLRNDAGQLTSLTLLDPSGASNLVEQSIAYTGGLVTAVTTAGAGTTHYAYVAGTELLSQVTTPDGVVKAVTLRDPKSDLAQTMTTNRGSLLFTEQYAYDGRERLSTTFDNLGLANSAKPDRRYTYQDATATIPGFIEIDTLFDAPSSLYSKGADLYTASGETIAHVHGIPQGWAFDSLVGRVLAHRQKTAYTHAAMAGSVSTVDVPTLLGGAQAVTTTHSSLWGDLVSSSQQLGSGAVRSVASTVQVGSAIARTDVENGALSTVTSQNAKRKTVSSVDQAGAVTQYIYDAMGRIRGVTLADGTKRRSSVDSFGRTSLIMHSDVGTVSYLYEPTTGLLLSKAFLSPAGVGQRQVQYAHDAIGRTITETDTDLVSKATEVFTYYYDGATPTSSATGTARGLLTGVAGPSYARTNTYRADGVASASSVSIAGQRTVTTTSTFFEDGSTRSRTTTVADGSAHTLVTSTETTTRDAYGRPSGTTLDGASLATYAYDVNGLPLWAEYLAPVGSNQVVTLSHDALTHAQTGMNQNATTWTASYDRVLNNRALIDHEDFSVTGASTTTHYTYSNPGFLQSAADAHSNYQYGFATTGLPTSITSTIAGVTDARVFQSTAGKIVAGTHHESFDAIGRAIGVDDLTLAYGPNGQVATASRGTSSWSYLYDESGRRIAKLAGGQIQAIYLPDGSTVNATARTTPVKFAGNVIGTLSHPFGGAAKTFKMTAVDARGTALSDLQGAGRPASPFGDRVTHPDVAATLDYAANRFDSDLGLVRMGVRDYDAHLSRFTTPDPLYMERIGQCIGNPVDCTLYAYARNNPLIYVDPSGEDPGLTLGGGGSLMFGLGPGAAWGFTFEVGVLLSTTGPHFYASGGFATPTNGAMVLGLSGGLGGGPTLIFDTDKFSGDGTNAALATPGPGFQIPVGSDGQANGFGFNVGKSWGASLSEIPTTTVTSADTYGKNTPSGPQNDSSFPPASTPQTDPDGPWAPAPDPSGSDPAAPADGSGDSTPSTPAPSTGDGNGGVCDGSCDSGDVTDEE